jgi:uncharacterized protein YebE (UPF0316 family)
MTLPWTAILITVSIFVMRLCDVSIGTIRVILLTRGQKYYAAMLGFFEVMIFILAISQVLRGDLNFLNVLAYCGGFAAGNIVGVALEERIALGFSCVRVFTQAKGTELSAALREADFGVTQMLGRGRDGKVYVLETAVRRGDVPNVRKIASELDGRAFVMVEPCGSVFQGYMRQGK